MLGRTLANVKRMKEENADMVMMRPIEILAIVHQAPDLAHPPLRQVQDPARVEKERERKAKAKANEARRHLLIGRRHLASSTFVAYVTKVMHVTSSMTSKSRKNSKRRERRTRIFTRAGPVPSGR